VSVNVPVAMPLTDTRSSWPGETDKVPAPADVGEDGLDDDGDDDNVDDNEPPADEGFVVAKANTPARPATGRHRGRSWRQASRPRAPVRSRRGRTGRRAPGAGL
jgi:hypothetical protein